MFENSMQHKHMVKTAMPLFAGNIVFDFSGIDDLGRTMNSKATRDKMHNGLLAMATVHEKLKVAGESLASVL